jgi:hypothetical protein
MEFFNRFREVTTFLGFQTQGFASTPRRQVFRGRQIGGSGGDDWSITREKAQKKFRGKNRSMLFPGSRPVDVIASTPQTATVTSREKQPSSVLVVSNRTIARAPFF